MPAYDDNGRACQLHDDCVVVKLEKEDTWRKLPAIDFTACERSALCLQYWTLQIGLGDDLFWGGSTFLPCHLMLNQVPL